MVNITEAPVRLVFILTIFLLVSSASAQVGDRDRGIDLYREGKYAEAIELLEKTVSVNEKDRAAWLFLAGAYVYHGETDKANNAFEKSRGRPTGDAPKYDKSVKIINKPRPTYTDGARKRGSTGTVRLAVEFKADGTIGFAFPFRTSIDPDLVFQSIDAAKRIQFEPAVKNAKRVTVINVIEDSFAIY